jgi:hypothetical protein
MLFGEKCVRWKVEENAKHAFYVITQLILLVKAIFVLFEHVN